MSDPNGLGSPTTPEMGLSDPAFRVSEVPTVREAQKNLLRAELNTAWQNANDLREVNRLYWGKADELEFDQTITSRLQQIDDELSNDRIRNIEARREIVSRLNEQLIDLEPIESAKQVGRLLVGYMREKHLLSRESFDKGATPEKLIEEARENNVNIDEVFRAAVAEYTIHQLTRPVRERVYGEISRFEGQDAQSGLLWLLRFLAGNLGASLVKGLALMTSPESHNSPVYQATAVGVGAIASTAASFLTAESQTDQGFRELEAAERVADRAVTHPLVARDGSVIPATANHDMLMERYMEYFSQGELIGDRNDAIALVNAVAERKADQELRASFTAIERAPGERDINFFASVLTDLKQRQLVASQAWRNAEVRQILTTQLDQREPLIDPRTWEAAAWGVISGVYSMIAPVDTPAYYYAPNAPANTLFHLSTSAGRARQANQSRFEWLNRYEHKRNLEQAELVRTLKERTVDPERQVEIAKGRPYRILPPIDPRTFYLGKGITPLTDPETRRLIEVAQSMSPRERDVSDQWLRYVQQVISLFHGMWFFSPGEDGEPIVARLWPRRMEKGNPFSDPDPSNWPHLQEEGPLQHLNGLHVGEFMARRFALESLYQENSATHQLIPMPELKGTEFKLSGNLDPEIWVPLDHDETGKIYPYTTVLPITAAGGRTQVFFRFDEIEPIAQAVADGLPLENLYTAFAAAQARGEEDMKKILQQAKNL